jgi:hypothetical protein
LGRSGGCRWLDAQVAIQFGLGNPLVAETGQRPQVAALDQVENSFIVHAQQNRDRPCGMNFYNVTHAFGRGGGVTTWTRHRTRVFSAVSSGKPIWQKHTAQPLKQWSGWREDRLFGS